MFAPGGRLQGMTDGYVERHPDACPRGLHWRKVRQVPRPQTRTEPGKVQETRRRAETGESKVVMAQDLGISQATIYRALAKDV